MEAPAGLGDNPCKIPKPASNYFQQTLPAWTRQAKYFGVPHGRRYHVSRLLVLLFLTGNCLLLWQPLLPILRKCFDILFCHRRERSVIERPRRVLLEMDFVDQMLDRTVAVSIHVLG